MRNLKRLFITDLDGTLLNSDKQISDFSKEVIQKTIKNGDYFTIASARTPATTVPMLAGIPINAPAVLMNGVILFDMESKKALDIEYLPKKTAMEIVSAFKKHNRYGFMYHYENDEIEVHFQNLNTLCEQEFYTIRKGKAYKQFVQTEDFTSVIDDQIIYFAVIGGYEELEPLSKTIESIEGIDFVFYKDVYSQDVYYLEIYSDKANKENGVRKVKQFIECEQVISFGDNYNDMGMFQSSDLCYAVSNSVEKLKEISDEVIASNEEDGVAKKMQDFLMK